MISVGPAALLALPLFDVWVFSLGPALLAFFANLLIMGWSVGLVASALVLRFGMGAESLAWLGIFLLAPLSGIYYPIDVYTSSPPPTDAFSRFNGFVTWRWNHEDWWIEWMEMDAQKEMENAGLIVTRDAREASTITGGYGSAPRRGANFVATKT